MRTLSPQLLHDGLRQLGFQDETCQMLAHILQLYLGELTLFNKTLHLTSEADQDNIIVKHIFDSLAAYTHIQKLLALQHRSTYDSAQHTPLIADIGSGGGFPGIPLAASMPGVHFVLIERMQKKCAFLQNCVAVLNLQNVTVENIALEQAQKNKFAVCVFRALHPLDDTLVTALKSLVIPGGFLAAYKARQQKIAEEMSALKCVTDYSVEKLDVPFLKDYERNLVIIPVNQSC
jgi:16S rRNA (guanine527-N7)-methyltransferase